MSSKSNNTKSRTISLEEFAQQSNLTPQECEHIYNEIVSLGLSPSNFYVIKNNNKYMVVAKYMFILSLIIDKVDFYNVDIVKHPIMGECALAAIKRKEFSEVFYWHLPLSAYKTQYESNKYFMVRKACLVQAIRLLFPEVFNNYTFTIYDESELASGLLHIPISSSDNALEHASESAQPSATTPPSREQVTPTKDVTVTNSKHTNGEHVTLNQELLDLENKVRYKMKQHKMGDNILDNVTNLQYRKKYSELPDKEKIIVLNQMYQMILDDEERAAKMQI